jgi:hypothetical protein
MARHNTPASAIKGKFLLSLFAALTPPPPSPVATGRVALGAGYLPRHAVPDVGGVRYPMCAAALHVVVAYALPAVG